jgi:dTDP-4-amino-4,6-dideoxygalactose transaminase
VNIPLLDLKAQYRAIKTEVMAVIEEVCDEQGFVLGPRVADFEAATARYVGCRRGIGCASGSDALLLALMALGVKAGDEVITVPFTFFATAGAISRLGAKPVFVDIESDSFNIDPHQIERAITSHTRAVIPVHLFGQCADMAAINSIAKRRGIRVIEDACQAIGAAQESRRAGALGDVGCFSFFPTKNLGGFGDGGLMTTDDDSLARQQGAISARSSRHQQPVGCLTGRGASRQAKAPRRVDRGAPTECRTIPATVCAGPVARSRAVARQCTRQRSRL